MAVSFGASVLARSALTMWKMPNALHESFATPLVYNGVDMLVCVLTSRYVLAKYQKEHSQNTYALPVGIYLCRVLGIVAGVAATALFCKDRIVFWKAVTISMGTLSASILPPLLSYYIKETAVKFPIQF
jgi:hypothetical protein